METTFADAPQFFAAEMEKYRDKPDVLRGLQMAQQMIEKTREVATESKTFIGLPHIHEVTYPTAHGLLIGCSEKIHLVTIEDRLTSLLAFGFNHLWCNCINTRAFHRWLLCHADIGFRTEYFLDVMCEDMERHGFNAIHVPMAIKDERGLMSSGVGDMRNPWAGVRRVTSAEVAQLPQVFGLEECCDVMRKTGYVPKEPVFCPNTGILLVKLDDSWIWDFPGFSILDKLETRVSPTGQLCRVPVVVPEDWNFGYWMQQRGLRVGATSRVRTDHFHPHLAYQNDRVWGEAKDEGYLNDRARWRLD